ncbi:transmembrane amino acid transporter family protein [Artemisia annua]|uniref:Transmembrane amino acid transporter family protein n=1 Tax=Artemisia annua TaxID=35608 RepID=A0A2U1NKD1_ARTAN|nr:transmembrane amino acid transporter family protein [Artemisia annua]
MGTGGKNLNRMDSYAYKKTSGADKAGVVQKKKGQNMCSLPRPVYIQEKKACGTTKETLTSGFKVYGEIEDCNVIMDRDFGKAKGFGRFMRPFKMFEGCKLHCQKATDGKNKGVVSTVNAAPLVQQATPQMMARNAHILALDPTHESSQGVRYDRYIDLARHTFGQKLRPWIVLPQQLIVQVGVNIVYMVTGGT